MSTTAEDRSPGQVLCTSSGTPHATNLAGLERDWRARSPAQRNAAAIKDLVARGEMVLTSELTGWVQQMSDTMQDLKHRQADAAKRIEPATTTEPPEPTSENQS